MAPAPAGAAVLPLLQGEQAQHPWSLRNTRNTRIGAFGGPAMWRRTICGRFPRPGRAPGGWHAGRYSGQLNPAEEGTR